MLYVWREKVSWCALCVEGMVCSVCGGHGVLYVWRENVSWCALCVEGEGVMVYSIMRRGFVMVYSIREHV